MENQLAILGKSLLFSEQIRRENGSLHTTQRRQATSIEIFRTKHEQQERTIEALKEQIIALENAHAGLNDKIDELASNATKASAVQAALLQLVEDFNKDGLAVSIKALLEQNEVVRDGVTNVANLVIAVQQKQTMQEQNLASLSKSVEEVQMSKKKDEREIWGLGNRIINLSTECNEMKDLTGRVGTGMIKLNENLRNADQRSEQAMGIARSVQHGQVKLVDEVGRLERSVLGRTSTLTSDMARLEPHSEMTIASAQLSRHISGNTANSKVPRPHKHDSRFERAATVDSQTTMSLLDEEEDILPSSLPLLLPEPARIVQEKAKTLATPFLTPGRQTRNQARRNADSSYQTRSATKPPFASSIPQPSTQSSSALSPRRVTRSQAEFVIPPTNRILEAQTTDNSSSSVPSMSSLFGPADEAILQDESLVVRAGSRNVTGTTPPPISPEMLPPTHRKRKIDDVISETVEPKAEVRLSILKAATPAVAGLPETSLPPYAQQMGRNGKPVVPTKPYKQNRRINMDDW